jgi:nucleotide-binding universal stress UspA family protein
MEKHLLLTVANDVSSLFEADFLGSFFKNKEEIKVTLFSVAPKSYDEGGARNGVAHDTVIPEAGPGGDKWQKGIRLSRDHLVRLGFHEDHVTSKIIRSRHGAIEDIILEGKKGLYDGVILATHATGGLFGQTFSANVSKGILSHPINFPVWICRHPEAGRRNVLLCVDEDEASMRIADHVGFVLQEETEHNITLFHVDTGERASARDILDRARQKLMDYGIPETRIRNLIVQSRSVTSSIREEAERGAYAVIAVGHDRAQPKGLGEWLVGSLCMKVLERVNRCVLWASQ